MRAMFLLVFTVVAAAPQDGKNATAWLAEGVKLESEGREAVRLADQLSVEIAKLEAKLQEIDKRRKQLEAESENSEATKDRLAPVIAELEASRRPIETNKTRIEGERQRILDRRQLERALEAYRKAAEKAAEEPRKENLSKALLGVGRVCETQIPENIGEAQAAYARLVAECPDVKPAVEEARRKLRFKGVDVYLNQFGKFVADWRDVLRNSPGTLETKRREIESKIRALGRDATDGLIEGFSHRDEIVRALAADLIPGAADEAGLASIIERLASPSTHDRSAAGLALARIFEAWSTARTLDREADKLLADLETGDDGDPNAQRLIATNRERANEIKKRAAAVRGNLPINLGDKPELEKALDRLISDESAPTVSRVEAAKALRALGEFSGGLVDTVMNGLKSRDRSVREACCVAAGGVDPANVPARHRLADRLMEIVQYEPESDPRPMAQRDMANDPAVREAASSSLGAIGLVKAAPALLEAMADGESSVRRASHEALKRIAGIDLGYEADPSVSGGAKAQAEKRKEGIDKWARWWTDTRGAGVLVDRFWQYQSRTKGGDPFRLYDREGFLREMRNRSYTLADPAAHYERAEKACQRFHEGKDRIQRDAVDLGPDAIDKFIARLSGVVPGDERLSADLQAKGRAVTRLFVAETVAKLIAVSNAADKAADLRGRVGVGSKDERAGAALALGFLPKEMSTADDRDALEKRGLEDPEPEVREAAARSLARVGTPESGPALAKVAAVNSPTRAGEAAQLAALRALVALAAKHEEVIRTCGELTGDEGGKRSSSFAVREAACDVLTAAADPSAVRNLWLYRARRDIARPVRDAATRALRAIAAADPGTADIVAGTVADPKARSIDRTGAALALGDLAETRTIPTLVWQIVDRNPPMALRASDPAVRAVCAEALGNMGEKARYYLVGDKLIAALVDPAEGVQAAAIEALRKVAPTAPDEDLFRVKDPSPAKAAGVARLKTWLETNRGQWSELAQ